MNFKKEDGVSEDMCYIGRLDCGCIVLAIVDSLEHKKDTAKEIAKAIKKGLNIERVSVEYVRDHMKKCPHKQQLKKGGEKDG